MSARQRNRLRRRQDVTYTPRPPAHIRPIRPAHGRKH
jgi:hypothetical protein